MLTRNVKELADEKGTLPAFAWPGGYPILYVTNDCEILCPDCANGKNGSLATDPEANDAQWTVDGYFVHYEGAPEFCAHCNKSVESAYGDPDAE